MTDSLCQFKKDSFFPKKNVLKGTFPRLVLFYLIFIIFVLFCFVFWPCHLACGILDIQSGTEHVPPPLEGWTLNHWTTREVPLFLSFIQRIFNFTFLKVFLRISHSLSSVTRFFSKMEAKSRNKVEIVSPLSK